MNSYRMDKIDTLPLEGYDTLDLRWFVENRYWAIKDHQNDKKNINMKIAISAIIKTFKVVSDE